MTAVEGIEERIYYFKKEQVPEGSIVAYSYKSGDIELILSAKSNDPEAKPNGSLRGYLSGDSGIVLSRYIQGQWHDQPVSIEVLNRAFGKKA